MRFAFALAEFEQFGDGFAVGLQPGVVLPGVDEPRLDLVEEIVDGLLGAVLPCRGRLDDQGRNALALQPGIGGGVFAVGERVEEMTVQLRDSPVVEAPHQCHEAGLVGGNSQICCAKDERLVTLVGAALDQVRGLGVRARDDDARHTHDVELEAGGVEALDLFVRRHQNLAALMAALLRTGPLVLDVVSRHAGLNEAADQVAYVRIAAVTGVGVGDDERPEVGRPGSPRAAHLSCAGAGTAGCGRR